VLLLLLLLLLLIIIIIIIINEKVRCVLQFVNSPKLFLGQTDRYIVSCKATYAEIHAEAQTCMASDDLPATFTKSSPW